jgi:hypothetical protein
VSRLISGTPCPNCITDMPTSKLDLSIVAHCEVRLWSFGKRRTGKCFLARRSGSEVVLCTITDNAALLLRTDLTSQPSAYLRASFSTPLT